MVKVARSRINGDALLPVAWWFGLTTVARNLVCLKEAAGTVGLKPLRRICRESMVDEEMGSFVRK
jgi:hypothetical protein